MGENVKEVTTREEGVNQPLTPDNQPNPSRCEFQYDTSDDEPESSAEQDGSAAATATRVHLVQSVRVPPHRRDFVLETDASVQGIGAVLSQRQDDQRLHPIAYASRDLSPVERQYGITELETLAVVWAISHFHHYLYGNSVTVFTDHTAVKAVLETANPTAKHARWWTRVYRRGVKIVYHPGRENSIADALSRHPLLPAAAIGLAENEMQVSRVCVSGRVDQADNSVSPGPSEDESVNPTCHADCLPNPGLRKETSLKELSSQELATSVLPEEGMPSAIDNQHPPAAVAVCNSPSSHTAGEEDPSTHEKLLEPVSEARGGEVSLDGTLQPASQLRQQYLATAKPLSLLPE